MNVVHSYTEGVTTFHKGYKQCTIYTSEHTTELAILQWLLYADSRITKITNLFNQYMFILYILNYFTGPRESRILATSSISVLFCRAYLKPSYMIAIKVGVSTSPMP